MDPYSQGLEVGARIAGVINATTRFEPPDPETGMRWLDGVMDGIIKAGWSVKGIRGITSEKLRRCAKLPGPVLTTHIAGQNSHTVKESGPT